MKIGRLHIKATSTWEPRDAYRQGAMAVIVVKRFWFGFAVDAPGGNPCLEVWLGVTAIEFYYDRDGSWE